MCFWLDVNVCKCKFKTELKLRYLDTNQNECYTMIRMILTEKKGGEMV